MKLISRDKVVIYLISLFFGILFLFQLINYYPRLLIRLEMLATYEIIIIMFLIAFMSLVIREITRVKRTRFLMKQYELTMLNETALSVQKLDFLSLDK